MELKWEKQAGLWTSLLATHSKKVPCQAKKSKQEDSADKNTFEGQRVPSFFAKNLQRSPGRKVCELIPPQKTNPNWQLLETNYLRSPKFKMRKRERQRDREADGWCQGLASVVGHAALRCLHIASVISQAGLPLEAAPALFSFPSSNIT